jgi:hypothetical protein
MKKNAGGALPKSIILLSFGEIAPAVTKHAC